MNYVLHNDGGCITGNCWSVFWYDEYVEITLMGEEQLDLQVRLFFDGKKERLMATKMYQLSINDNLETLCEIIE